jgi:hypothetical protein
MTGQIFTGGGGRIVGSETDALALRDAINDLDLRVAFIDGPWADGAIIFTRSTMAHVGVDFPVLALPADSRETWLKDPTTPEHLRRVYEGELPSPVDHVRRSSFEIVKPGDRRG